MVAKSRHAPTKDRLDRANQSLPSRPFERHENKFVRQRRRGGMRRRRRKLPRENRAEAPSPATTYGYVGTFSIRHKVRRKWGVAGGGGRTRTYEGLASGFTVRPLCHSGHSPMPARSSLADENAPGWPRRVAARLMLPRAHRPVNWKYALDRTARRRRLHASGSRVKGRAHLTGSSSFPPVDLEPGACLRRLRARRTLSARRREFQTRGRRRSVWRAVLVRHPPLAVDRHHGEVVVRVVHRVARGAIADFEIDDILAGLVDETMGVAGSRLEAGAHAGLKRRPAGVGDQGRAPFKDIDELVLLRVRVAQSRGSRRAQDA